MSWVTIYNQILVNSKLLDLEHGFTLLKKKRLSSIYTLGKEFLLTIKVKINIGFIIYVQEKFISF